MADRRRAYIAFAGPTTIQITTPLFSKMLELNDKSIEAIDLIGMRVYTNAINARLKTDFFAEFKYGKEYRNFSIEVRIYARTEEDKMENIGILEEGEEVFEVNVVSDPNKSYFPYLEYVDECI